MVLVPFQVFFEEIVKHIGKDSVIGDSIILYCNNISLV